MPVNNDITLVNEINFHDCIIEFLNTTNMQVDNYSDMKLVYIKMLENNYFFILNHELKLHMLIDLTYNLKQTAENRENILECLDIGENSDVDTDDE